MKFRNAGEVQRDTVEGVSIEWREPDVAALCDVQIAISQESFGKAIQAFVAEHLIVVDGIRLPDDLEERKAKVAGMDDANAFSMIFERIYGGGEKLKNS